MGHGRSRVLAVAVALLVGFGRVASGQCLMASSASAHDCCAGGGERVQPACCHAGSAPARVAVAPAPAASAVASLTNAGFFVPAMPGPRTATSPAWAPVPRAPLRI